MSKRKAGIKSKRYATGLEWPATHSASPMARVHPCRPRINSIASKKSKGVIKHVCKSPNMIANFIHQELSDFRKLSSVTVSSKFITCSYMTRLFKM